MSILIKNMAMPKNCETCELSSTDSAGFFGCCVTGSIVMRKREQDRPSWCPLIELPPHGDLIDRDALMKDGWLSLWKRVDYMGGYAIHDLPLINPSIPVVLESEGDDGR